MRMNIMCKLAISVLMAGMLASPSVNAGERGGKPWVTGYLPAYEQNQDGKIAFMGEEDWQGLTHVIHFAGRVKEDGSLDETTEGFSPARRAAAISTAHEHGVPVLFSVAAWVTVYGPVLNKRAKREKLVGQLLSILKEGYDGIDIDLEPIKADGGGNNPSYEAFIDELHAGMKAVNKDNNPNMLVTRPLLTIATGIENAEDKDSGTLRKLLARLQDKLDQINVMGYDLSTSFEGIVWHDSALYDGGNKYPDNTKRSVVSVDRALQQFIGAGVSPAKLGLGISLEIRVWQGGKAEDVDNGVTQPLEAWDVKPKNWNEGSTQRDSFANLVDPHGRYAYKPEYYHWDDDAKVSYLSIDKPGTADDRFISFNDPRSVAAKVRYAKQQGLGGVMIWNLALECKRPSADSRPCVAGDGRVRPIMGELRKALAGEGGKP